MSKITQKSFIRSTPRSHKTFLLFSNIGLNPSLITYLPFPNHLALIPLLYLTPILSLNLAQIPSPSGSHSLTLFNSYPLT
jgi:hypothetical protein